MTFKILPRLLILLPAMALLAACQTENAPVEDVEMSGSSSGPDWSKVVGAGYPHYSNCQIHIKDYLTLDGPALPVPPDASIGMDNLGCVWDIFAWNSFAALNWPVNTTVGYRGLPTSTVTFTNNKDNSAEVVWEDFKEKRELFQNSPSPHWNDIVNGKEVKSFKKPSNLWTMYGGYCSAEDQSMAGTASSGPFAENKFHNQFDETAEVQSQALEPLTELCKGYNGQGEKMCRVTNESVVGPRVWMGTATSGRPLYYEVKVNYDFFDYLMNPPADMALPSSSSTLVNDEVAATNAMLNKIRLPWRTSAPTPTVGFSNQNAVFNYGTSMDTCVPASGRPETGVTNAYVPCKTGAVHMKAAWVKLTDAEIAESPPRYHTTVGLYYQTPPADPDKVCLAVDTFGLVGLHAIQRVMVETKDKDRRNPGGAFIFATWEHRSILDPSYDKPQSFQYVNLLTNPLFGTTKAGDPYPTLPNALTVSRMIPTNGDPKAQTTCGLSAQQTCQVNDAAIAKLKAAGSVWANYRLVGTQFAPNDCSFTEGDMASEAKQLAQCRYDTLLKFGQPHFLANAVIETNQGLQHFLGLPPEQPRLQPQNWCERSSANGSYCDNHGSREIGPNSTNFSRGVPNMTYSGSARNMGGCQGCHGVAQQNGYSFSFVLLDGIDGAKADTEKDANIPATAIAQSVPVILQSFTAPGKYLSITGASSRFPGFYNLGLSDRSGATQWRLQPYFNSPASANFGGNIILKDTGGKGVLQLGQVRGGGFGGGGSSGTPTSALVGPLNISGTSRPVAQQNVFLVGYNGPGKPAGALGSPFSLVSTADPKVVLQGDTSSNTVSAQPPAAIPTGSSPSTALEAQVFNIVVVPQ